MLLFSQKVMSDSMWPHSHTGPSLFPSSVQFSLSVVSNSATTWTPGFPVHHKLPELAQTHVHQVSDVIQPSHPVIPFSSCFQSFPATGYFSMSQFSTLGGQSIGVSATTQSLLKFMSIELVMQSNCLIFCYPLLLLHSNFSSNSVFSNEKTKD